MKIREVILDVFCKTRLFEMAKSRDDAKRIVMGLSVPIFEHLIKLFVFKLSDTKPHWIKELNSYFWQIDDIQLKPSNKKIDANTCYNWMVYNSSPDYTSKWIEDRVGKMLKREYVGVQVYEYDSEHLLNTILKIIKEICVDIQNNTFENIDKYLM